jgi:predicted Zn-dependent protease
MTVDKAYAIATVGPFNEERRLLYSHYTEKFYWDVYGFNKHFDSLKDAIDAFRANFKVKSMFITDQYYTLLDSLDAYND